MPGSIGRTRVLECLGSLEPHQPPWVRLYLLPYPVASQVELQATSFRAGPCQAAPSYRVTSALADQHRQVEHIR